MAQISEPPSRRGRSLVSMPRKTVKPIQELGIRALGALLLLLAVTVVVWLDGDSYSDQTGTPGIDFIDALYYAAVTLTTTGYGDIVPHASHARLINAIVITPLRVAFLILLVGTTIEVLANQGSRTIRDIRWRSTMGNHVVIIGYGTKGRSAVATMLRGGEKSQKIVVIDSDPHAVAEANYDGLAAFHGDATRRELLRRAEISKAREVIICLDRDDSAILATLTVRQLNPRAPIIVTVREGDNVPLVRQSGATSVVTSSATVGRLMGLAAIGPDLGAMLQDMLTSGAGLEVSQRPARPDEVGTDPGQLVDEKLIGIVRNGLLMRFYDSAAAEIQSGDELIVVRKSQNRHIVDIDDPNEV